MARYSSNFDYSYGTSQPKQISPVIAWLIILATTVGFFIVGVVVGKLFFWENYRTTPIVEKAIEGAQAAVKANPKDPNNYVKLGWAFFQKGDYNNAMSQYKKAINLDNRFYPAYLNLGLTYMQVKKYDRAVDNFGTALAINPKSAEALLNLGMAYNQTGKYEQAIKELEKAYRMERGNAMVIYQIGVAYERLGKKDQAIYQYESALSFDPKFTEAQQALKRLKK